jgi:hypothetical protein
LMSVYDDRMRYVKYLEVEEHQCDLQSIFMQKRTISQAQDLEISL